MNNRSLGVILVCILLILWGMLRVTNFHFEQENFVLGGLAIASAIFILLGK